jgi:hypothetical protein
MSARAAKAAKDGRRSYTGHRYRDGARKHDSPARSRWGHTILEEGYGWKKQSDISTHSGIFEVCGLRLMLPIYTTTRPSIQPLPNPFQSFSSSTSQSIFDSSKQTLSTLLRDLGRPRCDSHTVQLHLSLLVLLHVISLQCISDHASYLLPLFPLQHGNLTQRAKSVPKRLFSQPNTPLLHILCKGQSEKRVIGCGNGEGVRRQLGVKDRTPFLVTETGLVVVEAKDQVLEFLLPGRGCRVRFGRVV